MQHCTVLALALAGAALAACGEHGSPASAPTRQVRVAAASSLKPALTEIAGEFEIGRPRTRVTLTFGSSGSLYAQLTQRAPFDVFLSADTAYPARLAADGLAHEMQVFARGRLMLWESAEGFDLVRDGPAGLQNASVKHVAIANPETAPYGRAAKQALTSLGLWDALQPKLVIGENVEQVAQFLVSGAADAGFLPMSLLAGTDLGNAGGKLRIEDSAYEPIEHGLVVMASASDPALAAEFAAAVRDGRRLLERHGLFPPP